MRLGWLRPLGRRPCRRALYQGARDGRRDYDWTGFYIGVNGGGGSSRKCWDIVKDAGPIVAPIREGCHDATGGMVGGQIGYRWQAGNWVFGLEAQGDWADLKGSNASLFFVGRTNRTRIDASA